MECANEDLWIIHNLTDWLYRLDKANGQVLDSVKIEMPEAFVSGYSCSDLCYLDSAIYSIWSYCWCGVNRFLKFDLRTNTTTDLGDIPLYDNLVAINDTIWAGDNEIFPIFSNNSLISSNKSIYLGDFYVTGIALVDNDLWVIDYENKKLKKLNGYSIKSSIDEIKLGDKINIYPNPASDYITIKTNETEQNSLIEIFDDAGNLVISKVQKTKPYKVDLSKIKSGLYVLKLSLGNKYIIGKIVKK